MDHDHTMSRYARQIILPDVGDAGQTALAQAKALIIGAGGLGAPVIPYLAGAGVGQITIVDPDTVSESNLHRQILFSQAQIGQPKAEAAAGFATALNPEVDVHWQEAALTPANARGLVARHSIVIDCADSYAVSYTLSDVCLTENTPLISASVLGRSGYVGGFCGPVPSLRAVFPDLPESTASCATSGVLGPVVGVIGAMQAQIAMTVLLNLRPSPMGLLTQFDGATMHTRNFRFDDAHEPENTHLFIAPEHISDDDLVVDLRGKDEAPAAVTPNAIRLTVDTINQLQPSNARTVLCCRSGLRAWRAADKLKPRWKDQIVLAALPPTGD